MQVLFYKNIYLGLIFANMSSSSSMKFRASLDLSKTLKCHLHIVKVKPQCYLFCCRKCNEIMGHPLTASMPDIKELCPH